MTAEELLLKEIDDQLLAERGPFPYADCRHVLALADPGNEGFVPELAMYSSRIAGFASSARGLRTWTPQRLALARELTSESFFEENPCYERLQWFINDEDTPDLADSLEHYERMRTALLRLIELVDSESEK